jgi:hypothetical protein
LLPFSLLAAEKLPHQSPHTHLSPPSSQLLSLHLLQNLPLLSLPLSLLANLLLLPVTLQT